MNTSASFANINVKKNQWPRLYPALAITETFPLNFGDVKIILNADGDDLPDDLDDDGSDSDEARGLDPAAHPPDATFWRVEPRHFPLSISTGRSCLP